MAAAVYGTLMALIGLFLFMSATLRTDFFCLPTAGCPVAAPVGQSRSFIFPSLRCSSGDPRTAVGYWHDLE